jgi:hypothetical protein
MKSDPRQHSPQTSNTLNSKEFNFKPQYAETVRQTKGPPTPEASILGEKFPNKLSDKLDSTEGPSSRLYRKIQPWLQFFRNHVRRQAVQRPCQTSGNDVERPCWQTSMKMQKNTHVKVQGTMLGGKLGGWETSWTA